MRVCAEGKRMDHFIFINLARLIKNIIIKVSKQFRTNIYRFHVFNTVWRNTTPRAHQENTSQFRLPDWKCEQ